MKKLIYVLLIVCVMFTIPGMSQLVENEEVKAPNPDACMGFGIVLNYETNCIQMIDTATMTLSDHYLKGKLGGYHTSLLDAVITSDGKTAIVSDFYTSMIYSLDISGGFGVAPTIRGYAHARMLPEDMIITPDDKYVMVTDGSGSRLISVIEISSMRFVLARKISNMRAYYAQAIAMHPDGETVIVADYTNRMIHTLLWDSDSEDLRLANTYRVRRFYPINIAISPDGNTIVVPTAFRSRTVTFSYVSPGVLVNHGPTNLPASASQVCVFSPDGSKLYYQTNDPLRTGTRINIFDVIAPGMISYSGTSIPITPGRGSGQFFGIESLALDPSGTYLFSTNPALSPMITAVSVVDLTTNTQVANLWTTGFPTGIAFTCPSNGE